MSLLKKKMLRRNIPRFLASSLLLLFPLFLCVTAVPALADCEVTIDGVCVSTSEIQRYKGLSNEPAVAPSGMGSVYFDYLEGKLKCSEDGGDYVNCVGGGTGGGVGEGGWQTDGSNVYLTTAGNNVGIGSSVPTKKLDVIGTAKATEFVGGGNGITGNPATAYSDRLKWDGGSTGLTAATGRR